MDNTNLNAKIELREYFLNKLPKTISILECFAGESREIYNLCYKDYKTTSLDLKHIENVIPVNNKTFIATSDLTAYRFFDLDAYGSPYELLLNIFKKKQGSKQTFVVILTDGMFGSLIYGECSRFIKTVIGNKSNIRIPALNRHHEFIIKLTLLKLSQRYKIKIIDSKVVKEESKNKMWYIGLLCGPT